jgi:hypothetical protein
MSPKSHLSACSVGVHIDSRVRVNCQEIKPLYTDEVLSVFMMMILEIMFANMVDISIVGFLSGDNQL